MEETPGRRADPMIRLVGGAILFVPAVACWFGFGERFRVPKLLAGEWLAAAGLALVALRPGTRSWGALAWDLPVLGALVSLSDMEGHALTAWRDLARLAACSAAFSIFMHGGSAWRLTPVVGVALAVNAGLALLQWMGLGLWATGREGRHAVYGTFGNPNLLGEWLAIAIPMVAVGAAQARRPLLRVAGWGVVALALVALLATGARAAALGLAMASPVLALALSPWDAGTQAGRRRIRVWAATAVLIIVAAGVFVLRAPTATSPVASAADPTRATRTLMRDVAGDLWRDHRWTGIGPGQYGLRFLEGAANRLEGSVNPPIYAGTTMEAHSEPAQALAERGLLGALCWIAALAVALGVTRLRGPLGEPAARTRFLAAMASAIAMAVIAALGFPFHVFPTAALFLWIVAVAAESGSRPPSGRPGPGRVAWSRIRAAGCLILVTLAGRDALGQAALAANTEPALRAAVRLLPTDGDLRFRLALGLRSAGRIADAEPEFIAALGGNPDPDIRFNLGKIALDRKDYPKAVEYFAEGLRVYPFFSAAAWRDYALALRGAGRVDEARAAERREAAIRTR